MRLSDEVVDIVIYDNKIFISKFHDGTDRSDGFIPVTHGEIEEYHQYDSGEITIYGIDGKYLRKLWSNSGYKSYPPKVTSVN
ncbi:MAG TPA: hypothetical protein GXX37_04035 [Clostridiaceae bacterium]|nr:hypothetical protein [Clostridiaceae bacterium]